MVYSMRCFCKIGTITFDFITFMLHLLIVFQLITQSIKGSNKKSIAIYISDF